jgi:lipid-A-disaccharide synthase
MIAGEPSADTLGAAILDELRTASNTLDIIGIGGPLMRSKGLFPISLMEHLQVMGFKDVLIHLPRIISILKKTAQAILDVNPKVVVTIDYPGFNLRLAKILRKKGFSGKLCHIVCPSIWAWGNDRKQILEKHYDLLISLLPFEKRLFKNSPLKVEYIGHPLIVQIKEELFLEDQTIAFFPGSRKHEIERNLPYYIRLMKKLRAYDSNLAFLISCASEKYRNLIEKITASTEALILSPDEMKQRKPVLAIAKCGTVNLELALRGIPTVVTYGMSSWDIFLAKYLFRIHLPYYSLPNLILNAPLFPELIGPELTDESLFQHAVSFLNSPQKQMECRHGCHEVRNRLFCLKSPATSASSLILEFIHESP